MWSAIALFVYDFFKDTENLARELTIVGLGSAGLGLWAFNYIKQRRMVVNA
jgi:hypothetical protein